MPTVEIHATDSAAMQARVTQLEYELAAARSEVEFSLKFRNIADWMRYAISIFADGRRLFVNRSCLLMFGYETSEQALTEAGRIEMRPASSGAAIVETSFLSLLCRVRTRLADWRQSRLECPT